MTTLLDLPLDLKVHINSLLDKNDLSNLRLVCKKLSAAAEPIWGKWIIQKATLKEQAPPHDELWEKVIYHWEQQYRSFDDCQLRALQLRNYTKPFSPLADYFTFCFACLRQDIDFTATGGRHRLCNKQLFLTDHLLEISEELLRLAVSPEVTCISSGDTDEQIPSELFAILTRQTRDMQWFRPQEQNWNGQTFRVSSALLSLCKTSCPPHYLELLHACNLPSPLVEWSKPFKTLSAIDFPLTHQLLSNLEKLSLDIVLDDSDERFGAPYFALIAKNRPHSDFLPISAKKEGERFRTSEILFKELRSLCPNLSEQTSKLSPHRLAHLILCATSPHQLPEEQLAELYIDSIRYSITALQLKCATQLLEYTQNSTAWPISYAISKERLKVDPDDFNRQIRVVIFDKNWLSMSHSELAKTLQDATAIAIEPTSPDFELTFYGVGAFYNICAFLRKKSNRLQRTRHLLWHTPYAKPEEFLRPKENDAIPLVIVSILGKEQPLLQFAHRKAEIKKLVVEYLMTGDIKKWQAAVSISNYSIFTLYEGLFTFWGLHRRNTSKDIIDRLTLKVCHDGNHISLLDLTEDSKCPKKIPGLTITGRSSGSNPTRQRLKELNIQFIHYAQHISDTELNQTLFKQIKWLELENTDITLVGMRAIAQLSLNGFALTHLHKRVDDEWLACIPKSVYRLALRGSSPAWEISANGFKQLYDLRLTYLALLYIGRPLSKNDFEALEAMPLVFLDIKREIDVDGLLKLKSRTLRKLDLQDVIGIDDTRWAEINAAFPCAKIQMTFTVSYFSLLSG